MGEALAALKNWHARISFDPRAGGGSTIGPVFSNLTADGRIVLAIADSDRKYPGGGIGGTASSLRVAGLPAFQRVIVLHVRCAENLLRSAIYKEAFKSSPHQAKALARLMQAETEPCAQPWRAYADLKSGTKLLEVRRATGDEGAFWSGVATDLKRAQCTQAAQQPCVEVRQCLCYVTDALGKDALSLAVEWMRGQNPKRLSNLLDFKSDAELTRLCEALLAWGIALPNRPA